MKVSQKILDICARNREIEQKTNKFPNKETLEYHLLRVAPFGTIYKAVHALECMKMQWGDWLILERNGVENYWFQDSLVALAKNKFVFCMGAACIHGSTRLPNPLTGESLTIQELFDRRENPTVMTLYGPRVASVPFSKGFDDLYEVTLENGNRFTCTLEHRVLTPVGYRRVSELCVGREVYTYSQTLRGSTSGLSQSVHALSDPNSPRTVADSQENYSAYSHPCDEPPLWGQGIDQSFPPSLIGAGKHTQYVCDDAGGPISESGGIPSHRFSRLPSIYRTSDPESCREISDPPHCASGRREYASFESPLPSQSQLDTHLPKPSSEPLHDEIHSGLSCNSAVQTQMECPYGSRVSLTAIRSIRKSHFGEFFDLTVPDAHHYFAEGGIHHNSGQKTFLCSAWVYTLWKSSPWNTTVLVSSTSMEALEARAWGQIQKMWDNDRLRFGVKVPHKNCLVLQEDTKNKNRDYNDAIKAIAIQKGSEGEKAIADIQGRKNQHVYWLLDEYSHMEPGCRDARGNLQANPHFQALHCSNKPNEGDPMYLDAMPDPELYPQGWESDGLIDLPSWKTKLGICLYFDGEKSPNMQVEGDPFTGLTSRRYIEEIRKSEGEDSASWWRWIKGFPKVGDIQDKVLTSEVLKNFGACEDVVWGGSGFKTLAGLDLGFREDGDPCVADFGRLGRDISGKMVLAHEPDAVQLNPKITGTGHFENRIARAFLDECKKNNRDCHDVAVDISSDGGILALALDKMAREIGWKLEILPISSLGAPDDEIIDAGGEKKPAKELFDRKVSQLWYGYRFLVQARSIRGAKLQSKAVLQLCQRKVIQDEKKRYEVETKKKMKLRLKHSPDWADSRCYLGFLARKHGISKTDEPVAKKPVTVPGPPVVRRAYGSHARQSAYASRR